MDSKVMLPKQNFLYSILSALSAFSVSDKNDDMSRKQFFYLVLVKMKMFENRTYFVTQSDLKANEMFLLSIKIPKNSKKVFQDLKKKWSKARGCKSRCQKGIELAILYKFKFKVYYKGTASLS